MAQRFRGPPIATRNGSARSFHTLPYSVSNVAPVVASEKPLALAYIASVALLLIAATFKNDLQIISNMEFWSELSSGPIIQHIKNLNTVFAAAGLALSFVIVLRISQARVTTPFLYVFVLYSLYSVFRAGALDLGLGVRALLSMIIFTDLYVMTAIMISVAGFNSAVNCVVWSLNILGAALVVLNFQDYLTGFGYVPGNPRMFGSGSHPNFFGVQLALAGLSFSSRIFLTRSRLVSLAMLALIALCLFLLRETGSRTAMLMFLTGSSLLVWIHLGGKASTGIVLGLAAIAVAYVAMSSLDLSVASEAYSRGDTADTRSESWKLMLDQISEEPLVGHGMSLGNSENSFLRAAVMYGTFYALVLFVTFSSVIVRAFIISDKHRGSTSIFAALAASMIVGANLEGYLADAFSMPSATALLMMSFVSLFSTREGLAASS